MKRKLRGKGIKIVNDMPKNLMIGLGVVIGIIILSIIVYYCFIKKPYKPSAVIEYIKGKIALVNNDFLSYDIRESDESFTENKTTIYICTKDPNTGAYYSENTLVYVTLHECTHYMMKDYDENHSDKFKSLFNKLLKKAQYLGIYNPNIPIPPTYCKIQNLSETLSKK